MLARLWAIVLPPSLPAIDTACDARGVPKRLAGGMSHVRLHAYALKRAALVYLATTSLYPYLVKPSTARSAGPEQNDANSSDSPTTQGRQHGSDADAELRKASVEAARDTAAATATTANAAMQRGIKPAVAELYKAGLQPYRDAVREFAEGFRQGASSSS
ncbi:hypothetical protein NFJ02_04g115600 [Pycnococcus provasolii]|mmetsp:Transcript_7227/g.18741  ORF Transcript_7227/g.18741 Transcript_7227/m.18741 type:complete len:160 (+) Transcript_7227:894-1373(+)